MELILRRDYMNEECSLGILRVNGRAIHTIERPWVPSVTGRGGRQFLSCVPEGSYKLIRHTLPSGQQTWALSNISSDVYYHPEDAERAGRIDCARWLVLIQAGLFWWDTNGGIAVGRDRKQYLSKRWCLTNTLDAMNYLKTLIGNSIDLVLVIENAPGVGPPK